jgi:hypothetical protein
MHSTKKQGGASLSVICITLAVFTRKAGPMWQAFLYLLGAAALFFFGTVVYPAVSTGRCNARWNESGLTTKYDEWSGCKVEIDGRWIPEANVQIRPRISN